MMDLHLEIERCINSLGEKFLKRPFNFFTESDAHSFLYYYIFRSGSKALKVTYPSKDGEETVLVHREYPTSFRFRKENMDLFESGGRGHYDLVILNPDFLANHSIDEVIAKDFKKCKVEVQDHLLTAIEFKFIVSPLSKNMRSEIIKDFRKLVMALEAGQTQTAYLIVFNRSSHEEDFIREFEELSDLDSRVKGIYIESIKGNTRYYKVVYINQWSNKLRFGAR
jgi:hypothetical protein